MKPSAPNDSYLLAEMRHRIASDFNVVSGLLALYSERVNDPDAKRVLKEIRTRVRAMALLHHALYRPSDPRIVDGGAYMQEILDELMRAYGPEDGRIRLVTDLEDVALDSDRAIPCALIICELTANALRHAFPSGRAGEVRVSMQRQDNGGLLLRVADNGIGMPRDIDVRNPHSLGLRLVLALGRQIAADVRVIRRDGTEFLVELP